MFALTLQNILIWSVVLTIVFMVIGSFWNHFKRFLKIWVVIVVVLVCLKLAADAGWISI